MHIVHVTPHLPPDQAANALLPWQLGSWAAAAATPSSTSRIRRVPAAARRFRTGDLGTAAQPTAPSLARCASGAIRGRRRIHQALEPAIDRADVVHVHSNGLLAELAVLLSRAARQAGRPDAVRNRDLALRAEARWAGSVHACVSRGLGGDVLQRAPARRARELGLTRRHMETVYPPVGPQFAWQDEDAQAEARAVAWHHQPSSPGERQAAASARRSAIPDRGDERSHPHASRYAARHLRHRRAPRRAAGGGAIGRRRASRHVCRARG